MSELVHTFRTPKTLFGRGVVQRTGDVVAPISLRALVVTGARSAEASGSLHHLQATLQAAQVTTMVMNMAVHEPTDAMVDEVRAAIRKHECGVVIGLGGGSAIDLAKAAAGLYYSQASAHLHMIGEAQIPETSLPWVAVPTTAGSGAEMTPNAVLTDEASGIKKSLRSWTWLPKSAIVDPELTASMPPSVTAHTGMDALTQAIESFTSLGATPLTDAISLEAARLIGTHLRRAFAQGQDMTAREAVSWGSMMAGMALANARLGAVHGFAHPVGTHCKVPHGQACAILLPSVMEFNATVAGEKYNRLAQALGLVDQQSTVAGGTEKLIKFVRDLTAELGIPSRLADVGLTKEMIPSIIRETLPSGSLAANPRKATTDDLVNILHNHL